MGRRIPKILFSSFIILFAVHISARAQDNSSAKQDTGKVIVVVTPGYKPVKPVKKRIAPSTSERSGANYGNDTTYAIPVKTTTTGDNAAPTTSERTGYQDYLHPTQQKNLHSRSNVGVGVNGISPPVTGATTPAGNGSGNTPGVNGPASRSAVPAGNGNVNGVNGGSSTSSNTTTTTTTTTTTLPNGKKSISVKKTDTVYIKKTDTVYINKPEDKSRSMKALYAEVGGPGLAISLNFDNRFGTDRKGLGYRVGAGYFSDAYGNTVFSIPFQVNYLLTKDENNFIELGAGTTFLNSTGNNKGKTFIFDKVTGFVGTATIGYRYQPVDHKLNFRIGFVPIFYDDGIIWAGGVSIGYNFK